MLLKLDALSKAQAALAEKPNRIPIKSMLVFYLSADRGRSSDVPAPRGVLRRDPSAHFWLAQVGTPSLGRSHWVNTM